MRCDHKKKGGDILFFFTSLGESRSSIVSAGSLEHATSDRATMQKPARPGSETTPWLFPEKLQRDEAAFSLRLLRYSWLWIRSGEVVVFLWNREKEAASVCWRWSEAFLLLCCSAPECRSSACALSPLRLDQWVCLQREEGGGRERRREREGGGTPPPSAGNEVRQTMCEDEEDSSSQGTRFPRKRANSWFKLVDIYFFALFL